MKTMTMKDFNDPKDNLKTIHQGWAANYHLLSPTTKTYWGEM